MNAKAALAIAALTLSAQRRTRIVIHPRSLQPGPNAKRYCRAWLAVENRPSGQVITPQRECWWQ